MEDLVSYITEIKRHPAVWRHFKALVKVVYDLVCELKK